jgi:23S rRNA (adenine2503-C2)-methyltransferase
VRLMKGRKAMLNLILYNRIDDLPYERPPFERAAEMARHLNRHGILTRLRHSAGQEVDGGCGQLRARENERNRTRLEPARRTIPIVESSAPAP